MAPRRDHRPALFRVVAMGFPVVAGVATWLWADATTSTVSCQYGGSVGIGTVGLVLVLAPPLLSVAIGWRERWQWRRVLGATITSTLLTVVLVWFASEIWWYGHGCLA